MHTSESSVIRIQIQRVSQLFNTLDPLPFREKDLDRDAEDFIVGWAKELPKAHDIRIVVHLPEREAEQANAHELGSALNSYFGYRAEMADRELRDLFRLGRRSVVVGLLVLAGCLILGKALDGVMGGELGRFIKEGLVILGWVANWKPIEIFLFDWWSVAERRTLYRRLQNAKVDIQSDT